MSSLFRRLAGPGFDSLPPRLRAAHEGALPRTYSGTCQIERGRGWLSRLCAAIARLPAAGESVPVRVTMLAAGGGEAWHRDFGGTPLRSTMRARDGLLEERMGPNAFRFMLVPLGDALEWRLAGASVLGLPLPRAWFAGVAARESVVDGRYAFEVRAALPLAGLLVHYRGTLDVEG